MAEDAEWRKTCVAACSDSGGIPLALVVQDDGEDFYSYIYRLADLDSEDNETLYETDTWLTSMWRAPGGAVYAVDTEGLVHSNETGAFRTTDTRTRRGFNWVWGLDDDLQFACGRFGQIVRRTGGRWSHFDKGVDGHLYEVRGTAPDDLYAVGEEGRLFHYDGRAWTRIDPPTNYVLNGLLCCAPDRVYLCGGGGMLFEGAGARWRRIKAPEADLYSLAMFRDKLYVAAGGEGVLVVERGGARAFKKDVQSYTLVATADVLYSAGDSSADWFDGKGWDGIDFA